MGLYTLFTSIFSGFISFWRYVLGRQIEKPEESTKKKRFGSSTPSKTNVASPEKN